MAARSDDEFDPRFDPAFQRGFEGVAATGSRAPERRSAVSTAPPAVGAPPAVAQPPVAGGVAGPLADSEQTDVAALDEQPPRPNPFLIALGVIAVVLVVAGVWGIQAARQPFLGTDVATNIDYVGLQILQLIAPVSVALGAATAIGILFVFAVGWQKRR